MASASLETRKSFQAPACLLAAVSLAIASQLWPGVPLAGAVALAAWGTVLAMGRRRGLLLVAVAMYAPLCVLAVMAQVDLALRSPSLLWCVLATLDGALSVVLTYSLVRQTGEMVVEG
jgi:hypothetical protein